MVSVADRGRTFNGLVRGFDEAPNKRAVPWGATLLLAAIDLSARLAVPVSLLALARGRGEAAVVAAASVNVLSVARGFLGGLVTEASLRRHWQRLVAATRGWDVARLGGREISFNLATLIEAVSSRASHEAVTVPQLLANGAGLALTLVAVVTLLEVAWLGVGLLALGIAAPLVFVAHRRLRQAQRESFGRYAEVATGFEVLLEGATELRVHGVEERHAEELLDQVGRMAHAERRARTVSVLLGLLPVGVALLVAIVPLSSRDATDAALVRVAEVGILGATALAVAFGALRGLESHVRSAPMRAVLARFVAGATGPARSGQHAVDFARDEVRLEGVGFSYPGTEAKTPTSVTACWSAGEGLALCGDNGAGKTTLALCLVGVLEPTEGSLRFGAVEGHDVDWEHARARVAYVPQQGFVAGNRSVAWHLRLLSRASLDDETLRAALSAVGLDRALRARGGAVDPLTVLVAELSGGERKRMHLARALLGSPELVVLDEPEAGLDATARGWLRELIEQIAATARVVVIAHDPAVIPDGFQRVVCRRSSPTTSA